MRFDLHTHHDRCNHAEGSLVDYVESAIHKGLNQVGLSDHSPYFSSRLDQPLPQVAMAKSDFPSYVEEVIALKYEFKNKIDILLGIEADFTPDSVSACAKIYQRYPMDYVIGSVHVLNGLEIFDQRRFEELSNTKIKEVKTNYYNLVQQAVESHTFDIIAHLDAIKGNFPSISDIDDSMVDEVLHSIWEEDIVIEVNTSGKTKMCGGWYPSVNILRKAHYYGVKITFGSDAHSPNRVGEEFDEVRKLLKAIGFTRWYTFTERSKVELKL